MAAYLAVGPWVLVAAAARAARAGGAPAAAPELAALLVVRGRGRPPRSAPCWCIPDGRLPIPPGGGLLVTPSYDGRPADAQPIELDVPQHPRLAPNGRSSMHNDGWATDAYAGPGPAGPRPRGDSAVVRRRRSAPPSPSTPRSGSSASAASVTGPVLHVLDPDSMEPRRDPRPAATRREHGQAAVGGPLRRRVLLPRRRRTARSSARPTAGSGRLDRRRGRDGPQVERDLDLTDVDPRRRLPGRADAGLGRRGTWWVTQDGRVGAVGRRRRVDASLDLDEEIANSIVRRRRRGSTSSRSRRSTSSGSDAGGRARDLWRTAYDNGTEKKPGQLSAGSGTTPTVLPERAGRDHRQRRAADARAVLRRRRRPAGLRGRRCSAAARARSDNSLVAVGDASVVVENNYGYASPLSTTARPGHRRRPRPGRRRRRRHRRVQGRLDLRRDRPDLGGQGVAGQRAGLRLHDPAQLVGRPGLVPHRHRGRTGETVVLGPHRHRLDVQQPLLRGDAGTRRLAYVATLAGMVRLRDG